jgi:hypothetical protein
VIGLDKTTANMRLAKVAVQCSATPFVVKTASLTKPDNIICGIKKRHKDH